MGHQDKSPKMNASTLIKVIGIFACLAGGVLFVASLPEIKRYLKMKSM